MKIRVGQAQSGNSFPFNYATVKPLTSSSGTQLRVSIDNDVPMPWEWSTATFYITSEAEA